MTKKAEEWENLQTLLARACLDIESGSDESSFNEACSLMEHYFSDEEASSKEEMELCLNKLNEIIRLIEQKQENILESIREARSKTAKHALYLRAAALAYEQNEE